MKPALTRRLDAVESALGGGEREVVYIKDWFRDSHEDVDEKLARWLKGEDVPGARSDVAERENALVVIVQGISPEHFRSCARCQAKHGVSR
jgi:hypothetical protein